MSEHVEERLEDLQLKGLRIFRRGKAGAYTTDAVLLAHFAAARQNERVCDLGMGGGILSLLLYGRESSVQVTGLELQSELVSLARKSIVANKLQDHISAIEGDIRHIRTLLPQKAFSLVVSNPPWFSDPQGDPARHQSLCAYQDIAEASAWLLNNGGRLCVCCPASDMLEAAQAFRERRLEVKRLRFVASYADRAPYLCLLEARLGARQGVILLPQMNLYSSPGQFSAEYQAIYHMEQEAAR